MNAFAFLKYFVMTFVSVFLLSLIVTYLYNLFVEGVGVFDWESAVHLGIVLGLVIPFWYMRNQALQE